jgi:FkbM family methyltransferase
MTFNLQELKNKYDLNINGVIHVGAHYGQEFLSYQNLKIENLSFFEPCERTFKTLEKNLIGKAKLYNVGLGNFEGETYMYTEGLSNSLLEPMFHLIQHPSIIFDGKEKIKVDKLDNFKELFDGYNLINMDVQGYELEVLKGGKEILNNIDYIITEVNRKELYKECVLVDELDSFLENYNMIRVETDWVGDSWGDAFYIKKIKLKI